MNASYPVEAVDGGIKLSEMTEEECLAFVSAHDLTVPAALSNYEKIGEFVKETITTVEDDPNHVFAYNYYVTLEFANGIKEIVNTYYGNSGISLLSDDPLLDFYDLQDSETVGEWEAVFTEYNCYAYALGYTSSPTDSYFAPYPGYFSPNEAFNIEDSVDVWADLTEKDLNNGGYSCVRKTDIYEECMELSNTHNIICLRKGDYPDYHYMRYYANQWYHKPGNTHILRFLYLRPDAENWTNEYSFNGRDYPGTEGKCYSGTIYYFAFRVNHLTTSIYNNYNYHLGNYHYFEYAETCTCCGEVANLTLSRVECSGPPCMIAHPADDPGEGDLE